MGEREQFKKKEEVILNLGELQDRFDAEFEEYKNGRKETLRRDFGKIDKEMLLKMGGVEAMANKIDEELNQNSLEGKTIKLLNNFFCWFPGGWYRELKVSENEIINDKKELERNKKIVEDLDEAIKECGHGSEAEIIGNKGIIDKNLKTKVLLEIYFKMRDKGYSNRELAT